MTHKLSLEVPDSVLAGLGMSPAEFLEEARFLLSAKLYQQGRLSSGQAAALCGRARVDFLMSLPSVGVPISNLTVEDAEDEVAFARHD